MRIKTLGYNKYLTPTPFVWIHISIFYFSRVSLFTPQRGLREVDLKFMSLMAGPSWE